MGEYFGEIKKNFGFGFMRLPLLENGDIDFEQVKRMTDAFIEAGFNYFDTAHGYLRGRSEGVIRECVAKRYPRDRFVLADKLTENYFNKEKDIRPMFYSQLEACGVDYFDFYLMHAQNAENYKKYKKYRAYEIAQELKSEGKIHHVGFSFHDKPSALDMILTEHPEVEFVQLQFNYADYDDEGIESRMCYDVCRKHGKAVVVMEPVKGGSLVKLPDRAQEIFDSLGGGSNASYAVRFAAGFDGVVMVLSGMSSIEQMNDNISYMKDFRPLSKEEAAAVGRVREILKNRDIIQCTACRYCVDGCPKKIAIPELFSCMNNYKQYKNWNSEYYYGIHTQSGGKASDCIGCGRCERACPQHLNIRELLKDVALEFDKQA